MSLLPWNITKPPFRHPTTFDNEQDSVELPKTDEELTEPLTGFCCIYGTPRLLFSVLRVGT
jgi:hypothetical protein